MRHDAFRSGRFSTHFVGEHFDPERLFTEDPQFERDAAMAAVLFEASQEPDALAEEEGAARPQPRERSRWAERRRRR